jgi:hypothetical protein
MGVSSFPGGSLPKPYSIPSSGKTKSGPERAGGGTVDEISSPCPSVTVLSFRDFGYILVDSMRGFENAADLG